MSANKSRPITWEWILNVIREETDPATVQVVQIGKAAQRIWRAVNGIKAGEKIRPEIREPSPGPPISPALAGRLWTMYQTARGSADHTDREAFIDVLVNGLRHSPGDRPVSLKGSPDLKEALSAALRSYETRHAAHGYTNPPRLSLAFRLANCSASEAEEELDRLADHLAEAVAPASEKEPSLHDIRHVVAMWLNYADDRHGPDCLIHERGMNWTNCDCRKARDAIFRIMPWYVVDADDATDDDLQEAIRRTIEADYHGRRIEDYDRDQLACKIVAIVDQARPSVPNDREDPETAAEDVEAAIISALGNLAHDNRAASRASYLDEGDFAEFASKIAAALPPQPPALTPGEAKGIHACALLVDQETEGVAGSAAALMREAAAAAHAAVNRLSGTTGAPESPDPPGPTDRGGVDEEASRIGRLSAQWSERFNSLKRDFEARLGALEFHRQGLTDGQAELAAKAEDVVDSERPALSPGKKQ